MFINDKIWQKVIRLSTCSLRDTVCFGFPFNQGHNDFGNVHFRTSSVTLFVVRQWPIDVRKGILLLLVENLIVFSYCFLNCFQCSFQLFYNDLLLAAINNTESCELMSFWWKVLTYDGKNKLFCKNNYRIHISVCFEVWIGFGKFIGLYFKPTE